MKQETLGKIVELADGFECKEDQICNPANYMYILSDFGAEYKKDLWECTDYPLLLRRAVEGWNREYANSESYKAILIECDNIIEMCSGFYKNFSDYQKTDYLTPQEQAIEACLIELVENEYDK